MKINRPERALFLTLLLAALRGLGEPRAASVRQST
jgi:hypothetical protein